MGIVIQVRCSLCNSLLYSGNVPDYDIHSIKCNVCEPPIVDSFGGLTVAAVAEALREAAMSRSGDNDWAVRQAKVVINLMNRGSAAAAVTSEDAEAWLGSVVSEAVAPTGAGEESM